MLRFVQIYSDLLRVASVTWLQCLERWNGNGKRDGKSQIANGDRPSPTALAKSSDGVSLRYEFSFPNSFIVPILCRSAR